MCVLDLSPIYSAQKPSNHKFPENHKVGPDTNLHQTKQNIHKRRTQNFRRITSFFRADLKSRGNETSVLTNESQRKDAHNNLETKNTHPKVIAFDELEATIKRELRLQANHTEFFSPIVPLQHKSIYTQLPVCSSFAFPDGANRIHLQQFSQLFFSGLYSHTNNYPTVFKGHLLFGKPISYIVNCIIKQNTTKSKK